MGTSRRVCCFRRHRISPRASAWVSSLAGVEQALQGDSRVGPPGAFRHPIETRRRFTLFGSRRSDLVRLVMAP